MALHWPTFFTRLGSAVVFCAIMLVGLLSGNYWVFLTLLTVIQVLCIREYTGLMKKIYPQYQWPAWLHAVMQVTSVPLLFPVKLVAPVIVILAAIVKNVRKQALYAFAGMLYIALPMRLLATLYLKDDLFPLMIILMIWCNDTLAYLVGSFIGKTPLTKISPKKTWEGTLGGIILTIVAVYVWSYFKHTNYSSMFWMGLALVVAVAGTFGDLLESKLKRMADVKDSGTMMPGHGGALDRFDSLLIATPFASLYIYLFMQIQ